MCVKRTLCLIWLLNLCSCVWTQSNFPEVKLEAFEPEGFRATIQDPQDIRQFAFHGNRNRRIAPIEPGEFNMDVTPNSNGWFYFNPTLKLHVGDKIYYWMFVQRGKFGYKKEEQVWEVKKLIPLSQMNYTICDKSVSEMEGKTSVCKGELIFESNFPQTTLDSFKWKKHNYIPADPDYEFCSYQSKNDTCYIKDGNLFIKPIPAMKDNEVRGVLDLKNGCSSSIEFECYLEQESGFILPPVTSAKIETKIPFKYGRIEVRAKLPRGDWIYPEIYLQSTAVPNKKIWIAYSRGNSHLHGNTDDDLGGSLLFGGPVLNSSEPDRSFYLSSTRSQYLFSSRLHTYTVIWAPSKISVLVDDVLYGESKSYPVTSFDDQMKLVLGVGVGGVNDFPDYFVSVGNKRKPWKNFERLQFKKFFTARFDWLPTWTDEDAQLEVEYVKIWAL